jgi:hypothetical protein
MIILLSTTFLTMGTLLTAVCNNCNFEYPEIFFGAGFMNHMTACDVPALDAHGELVIVNMLDYENKNFRFYSSPEMYQGELQKENGIQWGDIYLNPANNYCPKCHKMTMAFLEGGQFD